MNKEIEFETIKIDVEQLPTKYLALCEILAELSESTIVDVDQAVDEYIQGGHFKVEETHLPPEGGLH